MWWSDLLKQYAQGRLIAVAHTPDEARRKIREQFPAWLAERYSWLSPLDEDDIEQVEELKGKLEADLAKEPEVHGVIYVSGSE
jgi:hypothetical protein